MVSDLMVPTVTFGRYGSAPARRAAPARPPPLADTAARRTGASSASSGRRSWAPCCRPCDGRSSSRPGARARSRPSKARPRRPAALPPPAATAPRPPRRPRPARQVLPHGAALREDEEHEGDHRVLLRLEDELALHGMEAELRARPACVSFGVAARDETPSPRRCPTCPTRSTRPARARVIRPQIRRGSSRDSSRRNSRHLQNSASGPLARARRRAAGAARARPRRRPPPASLLLRPERALDEREEAVRAEGDDDEGEPGRREGPNFGGSRLRRVRLIFGRATISRRVPAAWIPSLQ